MKFKKLLPFIIGAAACFLPWVNPALALVLGFGFALVFKNPDIALTRVYLQKSLGIAVAGFGASAHFMEVINAGSKGIGVTLLTISATLLLGLWLARQLRLSQNMGWLVSAGTAICGGSAIAAVASVLKPKEKETSVAMAIIFMLNAVALLIFPFLGTHLGFTPKQFGIWCALAIHDTSSVIGAALSFGDESLKIATTVKLARALWIFPVALVAAYFSEKGAQRKKTHLKIPWFLWAYLGVAAIFTWVPIVHVAAPTIIYIAKHLFSVTLFLVGSTLSVKAIREVGWRPLILGIILWAVVLVSSYFIVMKVE